MPSGAARSRAAGSPSDSPSHADQAGCTRITGIRSWSRQRRHWRPLPVGVWSLHHLATSVETLLGALAELHRHGVKLVADDDGRDERPSRPAG